MSKNIPYGRCRWTVPEDAVSPELRGLRCLREKHDGVMHRVGVPTRSAVNILRVNSRRRSYKVEAHMDLRDGSVPTDEEVWAMWHVLELMRKRSIK